MFENSLFYKHAVTPNTWKLRNVCQKHRQRLGNLAYKWQKTRQNAVCPLYRLRVECEARHHIVQYTHKKNTAERNKNKVTIKIITGMLLLMAFRWRVRKRSECIHTENEERSRSRLPDIDSLSIYRCNYLHRTKLLYLELKWLFCRNKLTSFFVKIDIIFVHPLIRSSVKSWSTASCEMSLYFHFIRSAILTCSHFFFLQMNYHTA